MAGQGGPESSQLLSVALPLPWEARLLEAPVPLSTGMRVSSAHLGGMKAQTSGPDGGLFQPARAEGMSPLPGGRQ